MRNTNNNHFNINRRKIFPLCWGTFFTSFERKTFFPQCFRSSWKYGKININYDEKFLLIGLKSVGFFSFLTRVRFVLISIINLYLCFDIARNRRIVKEKMSTHAEMICHHITLFFHSHHRAFRLNSIVSWKKAIFIMLRKKIIDFRGAFHRVYVFFIGKMLWIFNVYSRLIFLIDSLCFFNSKVLIHKQRNNEIHPSEKKFTSKCSTNVQTAFSHRLIFFDFNSLEVEWSDKQPCKCI